MSCTVYQAVLHRKTGANPSNLIYSLNGMESRIQILNAPQMQIQSSCAYVIQETKEGLDDRGLYRYHGRLKYNTNLISSLRGESIPSSVKRVSRSSRRSMRVHRHMSRGPPRVRRTIRIDIRNRAHGTWCPK